MDEVRWSDWVNLLLNFWRVIGSVVFSPPKGLVTANPPSGNIFRADICIVTNCAFVGGNANTSVTELETFTDAGMKVLVVHCPVKRSPWKRFWIAERFLPHLQKLVLSHAVKSIHCDSLIIRGPRMAMTNHFRKLASRIHAERTLYIVNNSAWSENGKPNFNWPALHRRVAEISLPNSRIFPISPIIRAESQRAMASVTGRDMLAMRDWPPAFDVEKFTFSPRRHLSRPIIIGRHARDHEGKWLEDPAELLAAYPCDDGIVVKILGGADTVIKRMGKLPSNWHVEPFGIEGVADYLSKLDVFVNFPARTRDEAFGRTVIEALLCGLPTILPPRFEPTFGELALYCEPHQVLSLIQRIAADDDARLRYLAAARAAAIEIFGSDQLLQRLKQIDEISTISPVLDSKSRKFRRSVMNNG